MKNKILGLSLLGITAMASLAHAGWKAKPKDWGDFQMGLVNARTGDWKTSMDAALTDGVQIDRRYMYVVAPSEVMGSNANIFPEGWGTDYTTDPYYNDKGNLATLTIYMLQKGADGLDAVVSSCANQTFMKEYFDAIVHIVTESKGSSPIYVIEPDVWGYLSQTHEATNGKVNLEKTCHINDLGAEYDFLSEFENKIVDLPKAIIKTIKKYDPDSYAGILMAHWGYRLDHLGVYNAVVDMSDENVKVSAKGASTFLNELLGTEYRGDFIGVEKNGADAGWYLTAKGADKSDANASRYWDDENNRKWLLWSETISDNLELPLFGWQICLGHEGLPNTSKKFEDTFFEYFFDNTSSFIDAGFIGIMAGCNNMGIGTVASYNSPSTGDGGWFYGKLATFNDNRPYLDDFGATSVLVSPEAVAGIELKINESFVEVMLDEVSKSGFKIVNLKGESVYENPSISKSYTFSAQGLVKGQYWVLTESASTGFKVQ